MDHPKRAEMKNKVLIVPVAALALALLACAGFSFGGSNTGGPQPAAGSQPHRITGTFTYTNSIITDYYVEHAVGLIDMHGFVTRDLEWEIPVDSQTLGFLSIDKDAMQGTYDLNLPEVPTGLSEDVDNNGKTDAGVQIYTVSYWPNLYGGPYSEGDDPSRGWPTYLASVQTDTENKDEVIGGSLVVWAPDGEQQFPTGFGADGLLFTADDPVGSIPTGYSIVNLDSDPIKVSQEAEPSLELFEPKDIAIKDFSSDTYTQAFDKMVEILRREYAFNDVPDKAPDWDALYAEIKPRVQAAEDNNDLKAFYLALRDFTAAFKDGHVGLDGGDYGDKDFAQSTAGGYGVSLRELDDGRVLAIFVLEGGPAAEAGMLQGAEVTAFNGISISEAIGNTPLSFLTESSDFARHYQQARYMLRAQPGDQADFTFANPGGAPKTATLTAIKERDSFNRLSVYYGVDTAPVLPVEFEILDSGVGYVKINSNYDDLGLIIKLFQRALQTFQDNQVPGIIIDMRYNSGGANLGLAGFLTDQEIPMGQLEYYSDETGKFEPEGVREKVTPNVEQYRFDKVVLLVGQACFSACELEAYGFSQIPKAIVVGQTPTAGVEAEVARGQFIMPQGFFLQFPTGRFTLPDGSLFLEGQGVPPTVKVPVDETTVFSEDDVVLQAAIKLIVGE
jgi:C-terminal processing protease CtpA/Prc